MAFAYEPWVGSETFINGTYEGSSWDQVSLGAYFIPGVCTIDGLDIGINCDVQKRKKKEKATVKDLGMNPNKFRIITEIRSSQWPAWLKVLPHILPSEGKPRQPFAIVHPLVNANNIQTIYVEGIGYTAPSARKGMRITIAVVEWMAEAKEKDTRPTKKPPDNRAPHIPDRFGRVHPKDAQFGPPAPSDVSGRIDNIFNKYAP